MNKQLFKKNALNLHKNSETLSHLSNNLLLTSTTPSSSASRLYSKDIWPRRWDFLSPWLPGKNLKKIKSLGYFPNTSLGGASHISHSLQFCFAEAKFQMTVAKRFRASFLHSVPTHGVETLLLECPAKSTGTLVAFGPACSQVRGSTLEKKSQEDQGTFIITKGPARKHTPTQNVCHSKRNVLGVSLHPTPD